MSAVLKFPQRATTNPLPDKEQILDYLRSSPNPLSDVFLAAHFDTTCPKMRSQLRKLEAEGAIVVNDDGEWQSKEAPVVIIDPEFQKLIPPLTKEERLQLEENLLAEGCRDPLTVWKGHNILLDGHNRFEICDQYGIEFSVCKVELSDRTAAKNWIFRNQLGRRNLTPEAVSYFRGKLYNELKATVKNPDGTNQHSEVTGQSDRKPETAERLTTELKVSSRTIRRDGQYATAVDTLAKVVGDEVRPQLLTRESKLTKKKTLELANQAKDSPEQVKQFFDPDGDQKNIVERIKKRCPAPFPYHPGDICHICAKGEPFLRKYAGCWGVILEAGEFSARIGVWNGEIESVKPYNLNEYCLSPTQKAEAAQLRDRLVRLQRAIAAVPNLETAALAVLADIGKKKRTRMRNSVPHRELSVEPYLSEIEEKLLLTLEREFLRETAQEPAQTKQKG